MNRPVEALSQSFLRTQARTWPSTARSMELHANSSNNTVYADADGHIGYFHPQFIPRRDDRFDWTRAGGRQRSRHRVARRARRGVSPHLVDPPNGWLQNTNNWPYSAAGRDSPRRERIPGTWTWSARSPAGRRP